MHQHPLISFIHMDCDGLDCYGFLSLKATLFCSYGHTAKKSPYKNEINSVYSFFLGSIYVYCDYSTCLSELWWLMARTSLKLNSAQFLGGNTLFASLFQNLERQLEHNKCSLSLNYSMMGLVRNVSKVCEEAKNTCLTLLWIHALPQSPSVSKKL